MTSATLPSNRAGKLVNCSSASIREISTYSIQPGAVVPHDLALGRIRQREFQKPLGGLGILCVGMGIIRREDDVPFSDPIYRVLRRLLVAIDGDEALALEVLRFSPRCSASTWSGSPRGILPQQTCPLSLVPELSPQ